MESIFLELTKSSPVLGVMLILWYFQRKDYTKVVEEQRNDYSKSIDDYKSLVEKVQDENAEREKNYQETIKNLTDKVGIIEIVRNDVDNIQQDIKEIKDATYRR